jgi:hypothetical protein
MLAVFDAGRRMIWTGVLVPCRFGGGRRRWVLLSCAVVLIGALYAANAQQRDIANAATLAFHIPAQPLASALQAYGERTGAQLLYESNSAAGLVSRAVEGNYTAAAALDVLLDGSGLKVHYSGPNAITLAFPPANDDEPPAYPLAGPADLFIGTLRVRGSMEEAKPPQLHDFSATLQSDIQSALQRNARTRAGSYRMVLDLWVDPSRAVQRIELMRSTGDPERDASVRTALQGLVVSRPAPPNTPQPVRVVIEVRPLQ